MQKKNYIVESMYAKYTDSTNLKESLTEARNPENDEVNATIRKWASSSKGNKMSAKDQEILNKNGLKTTKYNDGSTRVVGKHAGIKKSDVKKLHPDYDVANYLNKSRIDYFDDDKEYPLKSMIWDQSREKTNSRKDANTPLSTNQFNSLQPYRHEKEEVKSANARARRNMMDADRYRQDAKNYIGQYRGYTEDDYWKDMSRASRHERDAEADKNYASDMVKQAKERHDAKKKNESLSLNESSGTEYEIYFSDLTPEAQKDLLDFVGIASPEELNWDVYPIAMLFDFNDELEEI